MGTDFLKQVEKENRLVERHYKDPLLHLVTYDQAKKLKKLGFNWVVENGYLDDNTPITRRNKGIVMKIREMNGKLCSMTYAVTSHANYPIKELHDLNKIRDRVSAPPVALALKWLRDKKKIILTVGYCTYAVKGCNGYGFTMNSVTRHPQDWNPPHYKTHEEAESAGLSHVLDYLIRKK
jgi:hypothetical protein